MSEPINIDPRAAQTRIDNGALLLDVRQDDEWTAGHAPAARHLCLDDLEARSHELTKIQPIVCVCRSGGRSAHAARILLTRGFDAVNLAGGMNAWRDAGLPVVNAGGESGTVL